MFLTRKEFQNAAQQETVQFPFFETFFVSFFAFFPFLAFIPFFAPFVIFASFRRISP